MMKECTLCYVVRDGKVLLAEIKSGFSRGKINAPGGKIEEGETPEQAAIRETEEEIGITPKNLVKLGFKECLNGSKSLKIHIFVADDFSGEERETEEARPIWTPVDEVPFDRMWVDDKLLFHLVLQKRKFEAKFIFDDGWQEILEQEIKEL